MGRVVVGLGLVSERSYLDAMPYTYEGRVLEHGVFQLSWGKRPFYDRMDTTAKSYKYDRVTPSV